MIDIKLIREKPEFVKQNLAKRNEPELLGYVDRLVECDKKLRELKTESSNIRYKRNELTKKISGLKRKGEDIDHLLKDTEKMLKKIKELEEQSKQLEEKCKWYLLRIPNLLHESVPYGKDENDNIVIKVCGEPPKFDFKPKDHFEIARNLGIIDDERAAKVTGHGFFYLREELVILDIAVQRFAIDELRKKGYMLLEPPFMLRKQPYEGCVSIEDFENMMYKIEDEDLYLIATAEHPLASMFMNEVLDAETLPLKFIGVSPCFRKEVGAHGKYTKGLFRMHQFNKIEQFIFCLPDQSWELHEELQRNCEELYQRLGLCFRVVNVCTGDIGLFAAKKYDTEVWMADGMFREIGSNSNCTDYQARRLNIKFRIKEGRPPAGFVHTLNNTALATSRTMIAILEQFQQSDGSVKIPKCLWKYTGFKTIQSKL